MIVVRIDDCGCVSFVSFASFDGERAAAKGGRPVPSLLVVASASLRKSKASTTDKPNVFTASSTAQGRH